MRDSSNPAWTTYLDFWIFHLSKTSEIDDVFLLTWCNACSTAIQHVVVSRKHWGGASKWYLIMYLAYKLNVPTYRYQIHQIRYQHSFLQNKHSHEHSLDLNRWSWQFVMRCHNSPGMSWPKPFFPSSDIKINKIKDVTLCWKFLYTCCIYTLVGVTEDHVCLWKGSTLDTGVFWETDINKIFGNKSQ